MKQFTQLLFFILLSSTIQLFASEINRNDTIGKFNEITDIELRLKNLQDSTKELQVDEIISQDTIITSQDTIVILEDTVITPPDTIITLPDTLTIPKDTIVTPLDADSIKRGSLVLPKKKPTFTPPKIRTSLDLYYTRESNGTIQLPVSSEPAYDIYSPMLSFRDTMFYNPLYLPVVFTGRIESPDSAFVFPKEEDKLRGILISPDKTLKPFLEKHSFADKVRRHYFIENPSSINISASKLSGVTHATTDIEIREKFNPFKELLTSQTSFSLEKPDIEGVQIGRVYWVKSGEHSLQFSQNYYSPNWHKGGTSNLNINSYHVFRANYQKNKVRFNNMLEWRLSVYNAPDDSIRDYRIGDDLIRYYGDFGLDAYKKSWSYSTNLEAKTQMFTSYIPNKSDMRSAFFAPLYVNMGVGMKYVLDKKSERVRHRRVRWQLALSPLSVNYKYVGNDNVDVKRFGIPEGKTSILDKGSTIVSQLTYDLTRYVTWTSRFKYFTNYSKVETELENTLNMSLSRFFSTRLYLHLRYDDGVPKDSNYGFLQVNEVVSFGLNFQW
ncbi:MAG TPA: DUF3078 domain-containing protein [Dysgonamonadaceae bacterium]|nr:DUF3078 domain-containing protein [Dysgonamonadaceae bacterium]MDD3727221.1 DUF3078 domain-containing protein [Dysgonamonadaceae bacterium]HUI32779.1 DUF3078 domain-containing protein [Dysgonamonadaceae bacterium]